VNILMAQATKSRTSVGCRIVSLLRRREANEAEAKAGAVAERDPANSTLIGLCCPIGYSCNWHSESLWQWKSPWKAIRRNLSRRRTVASCCSQSSSRTRTSDFKAGLGAEPMESALTETGWVVAFPCRSCSSRGCHGLVGCKLCVSRCRRGVAAMFSPQPIAGPPGLLASAASASTVGPPVHRAASRAAPLRPRDPRPQLRGHEGLSPVLSQDAEADCPAMRQDEAERQLRICCASSQWHVDSLITASSGHVNDRQV
jgi:hypothetical protein